MKKLIIVIPLLCFTYFGFAQGTGSNVDLPVLSPQSPDAYQLGKYGEIPVNESTGAINLSMPLATYTVGDISIPIMMNYSGNGVKVRQMPNWSGVNWAISAGGVITREIRDRADENALRVHYADGFLNTRQGFMNYQTGIWAETIYDLSNNVSIDSEADLFHYNFPGYSGSFYFDENLVPHLIKYDKEIKIEFFQIGSTESYFKITTPEGLQYFFGGVNASNVSRGVAGEGSSNISEISQAAFFLYNIVSPNGNTVNIDYQVIHKLEYSTSETRTHTVGASASDGGNIDIYNSSGGGVITNYYKGPFNVKKIYSNDSKDSIVFSTSNYKLAEMSIYDSNASKIKVVDFDYFTISNNLRFFLKDIITKDKYGTTSGNNYSFQYQGLDSLPKEDSYAIDHYGYYNGKIGNMNLIPNGVDITFDNYYSDLADRNSDFKFAKIGTLTQVTYPTGGNTKFEYESSKTTTPETIAKSFTLQVHSGDTNDIYIDNYPTLSTDVATLDHNQSIEIDMSSYAQDLTIGTYFATLTIYNVTDNTSQTEILGVGGHTSTPPYQNNQIFYYNAQVNKNYRFKLELTGNLPVSNNFLQGTALVKYSSYGGFTDAPGIRLKRIINQADLSSTPQITRYYYNKKELIDSTERVTVLPIMYVYGGEQMDCYQLVYTILSTTSISSNNLIGLYIDDSQKRIYPYITKSYGGDNFENGGEELSFKVVSDGYNVTPYIGKPIFTPTRTNYSWENGTLYKKAIFKKDAQGQFVALNEETYKYKVDESKSYTIQNYVAQLRYSLCNGHTFYDITNVNLGRYVTYSKWYALDSVINKNYLPNGTVTKIQHYTYDSGLAGLPSKVITTTSNSDKPQQLTKNYYVDDVTALSSTMSSNQIIAIDSLKQQHRISTPIQVETNVTNSGGVILSNSILRTNYRVWKANAIGTNYIVLPDTIQTLKGSQSLEDRLIFHDYYSNGNVKEISKKDGSHIVYIWGYNKTVPIVKIENATYTQVSSYVSNLETLSNADNDRTIGILGNEGALRVALESMRVAIPSAQVLTYTYDPLIGVTSITDPRGQTVYYVYDSFNRLEYIKDSNGKILSKNEYHYKN